MKLSAPIYHLKRRARLLSRESKIPLHEALDRVAAQEGFASWSLLAAKATEAPPAGALVYARLAPGDLVLVGARPHNGKTLLGLALAIEAVTAGHRGVVFTLEDAEKDVLDRLRAIGADPSRLDARFRLERSDRINADHIIATLGAAPPHTLVVIDYLQLLDQRREHPDLMAQVRTLQAAARARGWILVFLSQIDRAYDPATKPCPDLDDVRLPNPLDLSLFDKTCFLNQGELRFGGQNTSPVSITNASIDSATSERS